MRILLVEDDRLISSGLTLALKRAGHEVCATETAKETQDAIGQRSFDLLILDLGLPDGSGLDVLRTIRSSGLSLFVMIVSARDAINDRIEGLNLGADDYITKPFELSELLARVHAFSRRLDDKTSSTDLAEFGPLVVNFEQARVTWNNQNVELTKKEWLLVRVLIENPQRVFTREQLATSLYGWGDEADSNSIDVHVHHIRRKTGPAVIRTVRGLGYRLGVAD
jgi:two-component system response regulator QseB